MKKIGRKLIGIMIIAIVLLQTNASIAVSTTELNNNKQTNNQKINDAKEKEKEVEQIKDETVREVEKLTNQITDYQNQIAGLDSQIEEANQKIEEATKKLQQAEQDYQNQQDTLEQRMVALYEAGETSYLDVLLSSESVTDFISNYYIISEVAQCDLDLLEKINQQKQEIEQAKQELETSKNELTTAKTSKQQVSSQLQDSKKEKDGYVAKLSEEQKKLQSQIEELQKDNIEIDKKIKAAQAAIEAERKRQQQQQQQNQGGNTSNNSSGGSSNSGQTSSSGFIYPVGSAYTRITTGLYYSDGRYHGAVDFGSGGIAGTPVYAAADGIVVTAQALTTSYGNYVIIAHYNGLYTLYAHGQAGSIAVREGQTVKQGQQLMRVGNTGNSFGAHLHFEVRQSPGLYANRVDPRNYLP